jgi:hypothetical protein
MSPPTGGKNDKNYETTRKTQKQKNKTRKKRAKSNDHRPNRNISALKHLSKEGLSSMCRRRDLNPHRLKAYSALNAACLPIPPLRHNEHWGKMYHHLPEVQKTPTRISGSRYQIFDAKYRSPSYAKSFFSSSTISTGVGSTPYERAR